MRIDTVHDIWVLTKLFTIDTQRKDNNGKTPIELLERGNYW